MKDKAISRRIFIFGVFVTLTWIAIIAKLFLVQVVHGPRFQERAKSQYQRIVESEAPRGEILDRHLNRFAVDLAYCSFGAHTNQIEDKNEVAAVFAKHTNNSRKVILRKHRSLPEKTMSFEIVNEGIRKRGIF